MPAHALLPAVNRLLQQVEETSGLPVAVAQQSDLENLRADLKSVPRPLASGPSLR
ncbi:MAG: hypothetical protein ACK55R_09890 [Cyanobacteriota bacterium]|jgi:hypothetical protein